LNSVISAPDQILFRWWYQEWGGWHMWLYGGGVWSLQGFSGKTFGKDYL